MYEIENEMINSKKIGKILHVQVDCGSYLPEWRKGQDYRKSVSAKTKLGGGVLLELSHELEYIRWFFGDMKSVYANIQNSETLDIDVEDSVDMIFESDKGFSVSVHLDYNSISRQSEKTWNYKGYKELYKLIRIGGTIRIFPVFYGNYYCDNVELFDFLNSHFSIQCLRPKKDYSKESPIYLENQEIKKTDPANGINEYKDSYELMAHVIILRKLF